MTRIVFDDLVLVDVHTAAGVLGVEVHRLKELIRQERLAAVMHGGRWLVAEEEIERVRHVDELLGRRPTKRRFLPPPREQDPDQLTFF